MKTPIIKIPNPFEAELCERETPKGGTGCGRIEDGENRENLGLRESHTSAQIPPSTPSFGGSTPSPEVEVSGIEVVIGPPTPTQNIMEQNGGDDSDSDCLVIVEHEDVRSTTREESPEDIITSQSPLPISITRGIDQCDLEQLSHEEGNESVVTTRNTENYDTQRQTNLKLHNLPIHELKRKLAFCSVCHTQYQNHKQANLCLSKHGKRQCWLCLCVIPNTKDSYFQHCLRHHAIGSSGQNDIVGCPYCHKFFDFRQGFNQHIVKVHFSEDVTYVTSNNACLEELVDIFTGQPRSGKQLSSSDEVTTTCELPTSVDNCYTRVEGVCGLEPGLRLPSLIFPTSTSEVHLDTRASVDTFALQLNNTPTSIINSTPTTSISCQDNISLKTKFLNYKIPRVQIQFDNNKEVNSNSEGGDQDQSRFGVTRESVIRETPQSQPNLIHHMIQMQHPQEFAFFHHHHKQNNPHFSLPQPNSKPGKSYPICGTYQDSKRKYFHPFPSQYAPNVSKPVNTPQFIMSRNPNLPPHSHENQKYSASSSGRGTSSTTNQSKFRYEGLQVTSQMGALVGARSHQSVHSYQNPDHHHHVRHRAKYQHQMQTSSPGSAKDTSFQPMYQHPHDQLSPQPSSSPCLLEMEKLIHSTPDQAQYFNSVNSMLKTVAEFNPGGSDPFSPSPTPFTIPTTVHSSPIPFPFLENQSDQSSFNANLNCNRTFNSTQLSPSQASGGSRFTNGGKSDSETFKVPSNGGIKRRILTNFLRDEHHEINMKGIHPPLFSSVVPSPTTQHNMEYSTLVDQAQVEIRTGLNPVNCGGGTGENINRRQDKRFWEQVLKESNGMYGSRMVNDQIYDTSSSGGRQRFELGYGPGETGYVSSPSLVPASNNSSAAAYGFAQLEQIQRHPPFRREDEVQFVNNSQTNYPERYRHRNDDSITSTHQQSYQNPGYPRIMARVDPSGRPVGVFTADGQPCTMSGYELDQHQHSILTAQELQQGGSHSKYQHKIIRQVSSPQRPRSRMPEPQCVSAGNFRENQTTHNFPLHRKRKSSTPVRLLPNGADSDNIIVQNPFQDEESSSISSPSSQDQFQRETPSTSSVRSQNQKATTSRPQLFVKGGQQNMIHKPLLNERPQTSSVSKVDRFINYLPKFTSGGQITDFSGRNPCIAGESGKAFKNYSNISVATNIGIWNTGNSSVGIGVGLISKSTASLSTELQLQQVRANSEYYENVGNGNGIGQSGSTGNEEGSNDNLSGGGWPPFAVCQRYFETTQNLVSRLKDLDSQRKGHLM